MTRCLLLGLILLVAGSPTLAKPWRKPRVVPEKDGIKVAIRVLVPVEKASVWIEGKLTKQKGMDRLFYTPPLEPGTYTYRIIAKWVEEETKVTAERTLRFRPEVQPELLVEFKAKISPDAAEHLK